MSRLYPLAQQVISDVENPLLAEQLTHAFRNSSADLDIIEKAFSLLTQSDFHKDSLCRFFHNWSLTNNSAASLSGYCNRFTKKWLDEGCINAEIYMNILRHLNRISDEDLGATGGVIHFDLYYSMATPICKGDQWLSRHYMLKEGAQFKKWREFQLLKEKDLFMGILTTLIHEIYTHSEVEFILPLFQQWLPTISEMDQKAQSQCLAWIAVHTKGTERRHFNEALKAINYIAQLLDVDLKTYDMASWFANYLHQKATLMEALSRDLASQQSVDLIEV
ncbi:MAG: hypothetical protein P8X74_02740 [Reinekea sp.]